MKRCQTCGIENSDAMNFCLQCGATLANSPMVVNLQGDEARQQSGLKTDSFNKSAETVAGRQSFPTNFQTVPPSSPPRKYGKIFAILGGIFALFLLVLMAGAAIIYYNFKSNSTIAYNPTPTPTDSPKSNIKEKSPTPSSSVSPVPSPRVSPSIALKDDGETDKNDTDTAAKKADFDKIWVDYDVTDNGRYGMRVHTKFTLNNMKGINSYIAVFVQKKDGTRLQTKNRAFSSTQGELAAYRLLEPTYDKTDYDDANVFLPYSEFNLKRGKYNLSLDVDLLYKSGEFIQHLTYEDFDYTKE